MQTSTENWVPATLLYQHQSCVSQGRNCIDNITRSYSRIKVAFYQYDMLTLGQPVLAQTLSCQAGPDLGGVSWIPETPPPPYPMHVPSLKETKQKNSPLTPPGGLCGPLDPRRKPPPTIDLVRPCQAYGRTAQRETISKNWVLPGKIGWWWT